MYKTVFTRYEVDQLLATTTGSGLTSDVDLQSRVISSEARS